MATGDDMGYAVYISDDNTTYQCRLSQEAAIQGSFPNFTQQRKAGIAFYPWHASDMRHVTGISAAGKTSRLRIGDPTFALFVGGGQWLLHGVTYGVQGAFGERRPLNHTV